VVEALVSDQPEPSAVNPTLKPKEIAALERLSPDAIYRAIQSGDLPARKVCGRLRVDRGDYEAWKQRHRVQPGRDGPMYVGPTARPAGPRRASFLGDLQAVEERSARGA
jgi:predicted DNA-binding transcriptional regulator AlpA